MANLPETSIYEPGIYQFEETDPVVGGPPNIAGGTGIDNWPTMQLANRTKWLRDQITALQAAVGGAATQADIDAAILALIGGAPAALDTLNELAAALADDANYAATITAALASKADLGDIGPGYEYTLASWSINAGYTFVHGFGAVPSAVHTVLVCTAADGGFAIGDEIQMDYDHSGIRGIQTAKNANNIILSTRAVYPATADGTTYFTATDVNWSIKVRVWK